MTREGTADDGGGGRGQATSALPTCMWALQVTHQGTADDGGAHPGGHRGARRHRPRAPRRAPPGRRAAPTPRWPDVAPGAASARPRGWRPGTPRRPTVPWPGRPAGSRRASTRTRRCPGCSRWRAPARRRPRAGPVACPQACDRSDRVTVGSRTPTTPAAAIAPASSVLTCSRWSALAHPSSAASAAAPVRAISSACSRSPSPCSRAAVRMVRASSTVKTPRSQKTSAQRAPAATACGRVATTSAT